MMNSESLFYYLLYGTTRGMSLPSLGLMRSLGAGLGRALHRWDSRHRGIVLENLAASFPEKDQAWVEKTAIACYRHFGKTLMEIPKIVHLSEAEIESRTRYYLDPEGMAAMKAGKGAFLLTGHIGNWEWTGACCARKMSKLMVVARPLDWPPAERLVKYWRTKNGHVVVPKASSARMLLRHVRKGGAAAILLDQNVDWYDGQWVDFFGRPACSNKGLALLAMATKAPVIPYYGVRAEDGFFEMHLGKPLPLVLTGDKTKDVWQNTQNYTKALEEIIRQRPEQWFWLHQRWKTKPYHNWPREKS